MSLLQQAPRLSATEAMRLARDLYGIEAVASPLPSERDQNFLLTATSVPASDLRPRWEPPSPPGTSVPAGRDGGRFVLKIANAAEDRAMLEAQNAAMSHVTGRVAICPRALPTISGETIAVVPGTAHFVRLVTYLPGVPFAEVRTRTPALFASLGRAVGRLDAALASFDHPAIHRDFHWDLARADAVIHEHLPRIPDTADRQILERIARAARQAIARHQPAFRRSAVHHDANDWNVLVSTPDGVDGGRIRGRIRYPTPAGGSGGSDTVSDPSRLPTSEVVGIIDFGDMVHSWKVADPAVAVAYAMLDAADPLAIEEAVMRGYQAEHPLLPEERAAVFPLACLRLCMSACIAAWQQAQRSDDAYLAVSQQPIRRTLPTLADALEKRRKR